MGRMRRATAGAAGVAIGALLLAACGSSGSDQPTSTTSGPTTTEAVTTTEAATTTEGPTTSEAATTTAAPAATTTAVEAPTTTSMSAGLEPGDPCSLEEGVPDCIDPDGDGEGTYLIAGADCIANNPDPSLCTDLDGDGYAGYPDSQ